MNSIKRILTRPSENFSVDIISSNISALRILREGEFVLVRDSDDSQILVAKDEMLDLAYLLIEAYFSMFHEGSKEIIISINDQD